MRESEKFKQTITNFKDTFRTFFYFFDSRMKLHSSFNALFKYDIFRIYLYFL